MEGLSIPATPRPQDATKRIARQLTVQVYPAGRPCKHSRSLQHTEKLEYVSSQVSLEPLETCREQDKSRLARTLEGLPSLEEMTVGEFTHAINSRVSIDQNKNVKHAF